MAEMEREVAWAAGRPGEEDLMLNLHADTQAYYGRLEKARDLARRASDSAVRSDAKETAAQWLAFKGLREAEVGNVAAAQQAVARALALAPGAISRFSPLWRWRAAARLLNPGPS